MLLPQYDNYDGKLEGIDYLSLSFVDNRLFDIAVTYILSWPTIEEFALKISETLNLPTSWESGYEGRFRILNCDGFQVAVTKPEQPYLTLLIPDVAELVKKCASLPPEERLKEKKERERIKAEAEAERKRQLKKSEDERKRRTFHP